MATSLTLPCPDCGQDIEVRVLDWDRTIESPGRPWARYWSVLTLDVPARHLPADPADYQNDDRWDGCWSGFTPVQLAVIQDAAEAEWNR